METMSVLRLWSVVRELWSHSIPSGILVKEFCRFLGRLEPRRLHVDE